MGTNQQRLPIRYPEKRNTWSSLSSFSSRGRSGCQRVSSEDVWRRFCRKSLPRMVWMCNAMVNGKIVDLRSALLFCGITDGCTVHIHCRLRGGSREDLPGQWTCSQCFAPRCWPVRERCFRCGAAREDMPVSSKGKEKGNGKGYCSWTIWSKTATDFFFHNPHMKNDKKSVRANPCTQTCSLTQGASPMCRWSASTSHAGVGEGGRVVPICPVRAPHRIRHACSNLFCRRKGCSRALDLASWATKVCNSGDHLPPTSMAKTVRRARLPLLRSLRLLARWSTTPSMSAAPVCGEPSQCEAHTSVVSKANWDPPKMGHPSATTSNLRLSAASGRGKSRSRTRTLVVTRAPASRMLDLGQFDSGQSGFFRLGPMVDLGQFDLGQFDLGQFDLANWPESSNLCVCVVCVSAVCVLSD